MGTPEFATEALRVLIDNDYNISAVFSQPDKPVGRKQILTPPLVKELAQKNNLAVFQPKNLKGTETVEKIKKLNPDLIVVVAYGQIIPKGVLEIPKFGCINIHASLLPRWRGASPIAQAILAGDKKTGVTIMKIDDKLDHGPTLSQKKIEIQNNDNLETLSQKLSKLGAELLIKTLPNYLQCEMELHNQDESLVTYAPLINREDGKIDWTKSVEKIERQVRAFTPWPGSWTNLNNKRLKIIKASIFDKKEKNTNPGLISISDNKLITDCGQGKLNLDIVQLEGKKQMSSKEFIRGHSNILDLKLV